MSDELKKKLIKYGVTAFIGALMAYITMSNYGLFTETNLSLILKIIADAFTIPGVILIMVGFLVWVSQDGFFDGITYALSYTFKMLIPGTDKTMLKYEEYIETKAEKRKEKNKDGFAYLFIVGGVFTLIAVIFVILYYTI